MADGMPLDAQRIIAAVRDETGLIDLDDETLPDRLATLLSVLNARLDEKGWARAAAVARGLLTQRLKFFEARKRFPIAQERIERPVIAMGEARAGTTVLQMLLGCDPASRLLEFWEVMRPAPPPGISDTQERRRLADEDWREILALIPKWLISHPYNAMLGRNPPECERLWAMDFRTMTPTAWWRVPIVPLLTPELRFTPDLKRQYEIHRMMLQHLQYEHPSRRWVLKGTLHQHRLATLLDTYPDGIFVWIHRDPLQAIASRFELHAQIYEGIAGEIDRRAFARVTIETCVANFLGAAENPLADDPRIHHLHYKTFTANPIAAIRSVYDRAQLDFTGTFESAMRCWMAENPSDRFGRFTYATDALGVDIAALDRTLDPYRERFGVPREQQKG